MHDAFEETLTPLLRLKTVADLRDGIFTPRERGEQKQAGILLKPAALIENIGQKICDDLALLSPEFGNTHGPDLQIEGETVALHVHPTATLSKFAVFDTTAGPIVIDANARVGALSLIKGPAYIGKKTQLERCIFANAIAGYDCRLGGEISDSIIGDFSNKHHEGFLGHSLVGDWVNLGALTTTSDLKNNYSEVRLTYQEKIYPSGTIKFGSIIGDYVKTAIGTMLSTGSVIDLGANVFGETIRSGYMRPLLWGRDADYEREKFLRDAERMMARRGQKLPDGFLKVLSTIA